MTRASTPGSLSTSTAMACRSISVTRASDEHHAFFRDGLRGLVLRPEQHLVMGRARRDHRKAILGRVDRDVADECAIGVQHLTDRIVELRRLLDPPPDRAEGLRQLHEIWKRRGKALPITDAVQLL